MPTQRQQRPAEWGSQAAAEPAGGLAGMMLLLPPHADVVISVGGEGGGGDAVRSLRRGLASRSAAASGCRGTALTIDVGASRRRTRKRRRRQRRRRRRRRPQRKRRLPRRRRCARRQPQVLRPAFAEPQEGPHSAPPVAHAALAPRLTAAHPLTPPRPAPRSRQRQRSRRRRSRPQVMPCRVVKYVRGPIVTETDSTSIHRGSDGRRKPQGQQ
jgi:hypothetical protein